VDSWSNGLVVRESPAGKDLSTDEEDIIEIRSKATAIEFIKYIAFAVVRGRVCEFVEAF
jgi:hypothetical protein